MAVEKDDTISIHVNLKIHPMTLQAIVTNAKNKSGCDAGGRYHVDTADKVGFIISRFLSENNFHAYVQNLSNYE